MNLFLTKKIKTLEFQRKCIKCARIAFVWFCLIFSLIKCLIYSHNINYYEQKINELNEFSGVFFSKEKFKCNLEFSEAFAVKLVNIYI